MSLRHYSSVPDGPNTGFIDKADFDTFMEGVVSFHPKDADLILLDSPPYRGAVQA